MPIKAHYSPKSSAMPMRYLVHNFDWDLIHDFAHNITVWAYNSLAKLVKYVPSPDQLTLVERFKTLEPLKKEFGSKFWVSEGDMYMRCLLEIYYEGEVKPRLVAEDIFKAEHLIKSPYFIKQVNIRPYTGSYELRCIIEHEDFQP